MMTEGARFDITDAMLTARIRVSRDGLPTTTDTEAQRSMRKAGMSVLNLACVLSPWSRSVPTHLGARSGLLSSNELALASQRPFPKRP